MVITFKDYYTDNHEIIFRKSKPKHQREALRRLERFAAFRDNGRRDIKQIKTNDVHVFMDQLLHVSQLSESTANRYGVAVSAVMNNALLNGAVTHKVSVDLFKETAGRPRYFSDDEIKQITTFLRYSDHPWMEHMFTLSIHTGARLGEIVRIGVDEQVLVDDEGDRLLWLPDSKSGEERHIPLSDDAFVAVEALRAVNRHLLRKGRPRKHFYSDKDFYATWARLRAKVAPNDKNFVFHVARHTAATHLANRLNLSSLVVSKLLGHKNVKTTMKYVKLENDTAKKAAKGMQALSDARQNR